MAEVVMRWQRQGFKFRDRAFEVEHFDVAEAESSSSGEDEEQQRRRRQRRDLEESLERCEAELGACLWLDTNLAALRVLENWRDSYEGLHVLELGAGAGACGIAMAHDGADAIVADVDALLPLMQRNVQLNQLPPPTAQAERPVASGSAADSVGEGSREKAAEAFCEQEACAPLPEISEEPSARKPRGRKGKAAEDEESSLSNRAARAAARGRKAAGPRQRASRAQAARAASLEVSRSNGTCEALAVEWGREAQSPVLPAAAFDIVVVCDCLYENRESWNALQSVVTRVLAGSDAALMLASAMHRKPFLDQFVLQLEAAGFAIAKRDEGKDLGEVAVAILHPPGRPVPDHGPELPVPVGVGATGYS